jgi:hypothetical protein
MIEDKSLVGENLHERTNRARTNQAVTKLCGTDVKNPAEDTDQSGS